LLLLLQRPVLPLPDAPELPLLVLEPELEVVDAADDPEPPI